MNKKVTKFFHSIFNGNYTRYFLVLILLFAYSVRIYRVSEPPEYYFDEVYHAFTAQFYATNDPKGYEWWNQAPDGVAYEWLHPPLAKLAQGFSIDLFGNNSFAWRFPSVIAGTFVIAAIYFLTYSLTKNQNAGLLAAFIGSLDGLLLAMSRITMNDAYLTFFMIMSFAVFWRYLQAKPYTKKQYGLMTLAGLAAGLSMASKWSGLFVLIVYWVCEVVVMLGADKINKVRKALNFFIVYAGLPLLIIFLVAKNFSDLTSSQGSQYAPVIFSLIGIELLLAMLLLGWKKALLLVGNFVVIPFTVYVLSFGQFWLQERTNGVDNLVAFRDLHYQIWWYQTNLDATHPWESRPYEWMLNLKPVWFYVKYAETEISNIYAQANPAIAWGGLIAIFWASLFGILKKRYELLYLVLAYFAVWLPWLASPRIMFYYHYTPGIALICVALGLLLHHLFNLKQKWSTLLAASYITATIGLFIFFLPHWTGYPIPKEWVEHYYWFESWKP